ncbi:taste receptor type 2 member [Lynx pardinus]|uniref:Taste receptor type 2 member n=1 Tax=Lynx pardinus TaxID=191816 RepID=A0A485PNN9_LYNPA|nr:taste receptor type 2 member [Lynx pardinus]
MLASDIWKAPSSPARAGCQGSQSRDLTSSPTMPSPALIFTVIFFLESLAAVLQNGFVVTVLGREWVRCRMLPASDVIVASLATSRFCLHGWPS